MYRNQKNLGSFCDRFPFWERQGNLSSVENTFFNLDSNSATKESWKVCGISADYTDFAAERLGDMR